VSKEYGIVANVTGIDRFVRQGSKAWLSGGTGGEGWYKFQWICRTRGGRLIEKWMPTERLSNFRCAWIPKHIWALADGHLYMTGSKVEMEKRAADLNEFHSTLKRS